MDGQMDGFAITISHSACISTLTHNKNDEKYRERTGCMHKCRESSAKVDFSVV